MPVVELLLDGSWVDITGDVRVDPGITITFGVPNESAIADPSTCNLTVNNRDGKYSPRNTAGPYYGHLTRNTPLRVTEGSSVRFAGEISEFPARWNLPGTDVWTPLVASGILRRLNRSRLLETTLVTGLRKIATAGHVTGYWPMEDLAGAATFESEIPGVAPARILAGTPVLAAVDPGVSSDPIPTWAGAFGQAIPRASTGTGFTAGFYVVIPEGGTTDQAELVRVHTAPGTIDYWALRYETAGGGRLAISAVTKAVGITPPAVVLNSSLTFTAGMNGKAVYIKLEAANNGANVDWYVQPYGNGVGFGATLAGQSTGVPTVAYIGAGQALIGDVGIGQLVLGDTSTALFSATLDQALVGYAGETVWARMLRITTLAGIAFSGSFGSVQSTLLGPQPSGSALDILRDAEKADAGGILYDDNDAIGLTYMTRSSRYSRAVTAALDYAAGHLSTPLEPTDDDANIRNDVTAARVDGSAARAIDTTGPLNVNDYPVGVGPYTFSDTYNVYTDAQLPDLANWLLTQGTNEETRWPHITVDLVKNPGLVAQVDALRPGYRMTVANLPTWQGAGSADLAVIGWTEYFGHNTRTITFNCEPGGAATGFNVLILDHATYGKLDFDNRLGF